jgi:GntR family transcriptional regulator of vanillate catabolism
MILGGELASGEHLQELALCETFGVSRTPVREALIALHQEGLLVYRENRGFTVREFTLQEILDAYVVRANLEGLACQIAAERGIDEQTRITLEAAVAKGDELLSPGRLTDEAYLPWCEMNNVFHQTILEATKNECLKDMTRRTLAIPLASSRVVHWYDYYEIKRSHSTHHAILEALVKRQNIRADALMREHIYFASTVIRSNYEKLSLQRGAVGA